MALDVYKDWLGITDGPRPPDHYTLLRLVKFEDDPQKVRNNYRKLNGHVRKYASGQYSVQSQDLLNELAKAMLLLTDPERKREYDESQGRVFDEDESSSMPMGKILAKRGVITRDQVKEVEEFAEMRGLSMRDAFVQMKLVDQETATQAYAEELGLSFVDLKDVTPDDDVLDQIPKQFCKRNTLLPLFIDDNVLLVACVEEISHEVEDELRLRFNVPIRRVLAAPKAIGSAIGEYYAPGVRDDAGSKRPAAAANSGSTAADSGAKKVQKAAGPRTAFTQLPPAEQAQRKSFGLIFMLWSVIGSVVIDHFLMKPVILGVTTGFFSVVPFSLTSLIVPPIVIWYVLKVYWK